MMAYTDKPMEFSGFIMVTIGVFMNTFYSAYQGQALMDSSESIYDEMLVFFFYRHFIIIVSLKSNQIF